MPDGLTFLTFSLGRNKNVCVFCWPPFFVGAGEEDVLKKWLGSWIT